MLYGIPDMLIYFFGTINRRTTRSVLGWEGVDIFESRIWNPYIGLPVLRVEPLKGQIGGHLSQSLLQEAAAVQAARQPATTVAARQESVQDSAQAIFLAVSGQQLHQGEQPVAVLLHRTGQL